MFKMFYGVCVCICTYVYLAPRLGRKVDINGERLREEKSGNCLQLFPEQQGSVELKAWTVKSNFQCQILALTLTRHVALSK